MAWEFDYKTQEFIDSSAGYAIAAWTGEGSAPANYFEENAQYFEPGTINVIQPRPSIQTGAPAMVMPAIGQQAYNPLANVIGNVVGGVLGATPLGGIANAALGVLGASGGQYTGYQTPGGGQINFSPTPFARRMALASMLSDPTLKMMAMRGEYISPLTVLVATGNMALAIQVASIRQPTRKRRRSRNRPFYPGRRAYQPQFRPRPRYINANYRYR